MLKSNTPYLKEGGLVVGIDKKNREKSNKERLYTITNDTHTMCIGATRIW